ncbi:IclR family transcriptional regulator [Cupriavidus sp. LEh25]|uniref:IclR family transcriptional regulator n=1 Tax=Cupriavidus consociatus TaxID=2821357 RepID=UPI001AE23D24|nr:IclR family transcriptional regulator [Cupriavidus sp. LEh25]
MAAISLQPDSSSKAAISASKEEVPSNALARGIRILQCFTAEEHDLSGKDIVQRSMLPKPTAFRLMATLRDLGLLHYSERRNRYTLAPGVLQLSAPLLSGMTIRSIARPLMQELADAVDGQISLAASTHDMDLIYVETVQGRENSVFRPEIGTTVSLTRAATGRAFLSLLPEDQYNAILSRLRVEHPERRSWFDDKMHQTRTDLAELGYCRNQGELHHNTVGVAVPVRAIINDRRFIFGCTIPAYRLSSEPTLLSDLGMRLSTLVHNVEVALGAPRG